MLRNDILKCLLNLVYSGGELRLNKALPVFFLASLENGGQPMSSLLLTVQFFVFILFFKQVYLEGTLKTTLVFPPWCNHIGWLGVKHQVTWSSCTGWLGVKHQVTWYNHTGRLGVKHQVTWCNRTGFLDVIYLVTWCNHIGWLGVKHQVTYLLMGRWRNEMYYNIMYP